MSIFTSLPPAWSLYATMQLYIRAGGAIQAIGACSEADFAAFVDTCLMAYQHTANVSQERLDMVRMELAGLEYDDCGKWFAVLVLQEACIPVALFPTLEDAQASGSEQVL